MPAKEPDYKREPTYCLLAFGEPVAQSVWLVLDGDILYVDKNGNGDLTESGEMVHLRQISAEAFAIGTLGKDGRYAADVQVVDKTTEEGQTYRNYLCHILVGDIRHSAQASFANSWANADVLRFDGPLMMGISASPLKRGESTQLFAFVGVQGLVNGKLSVHTQLPFSAAPIGCHPEALIEFPANAEGAPIRETVILSHRC